MGLRAGAPLAPSFPRCDPVPLLRCGRGRGPGDACCHRCMRESEDPGGLGKGRWVWGHGRAKEWGCMAGSRREKKKKMLEVCLKLASGRVRRDPERTFCLP